MIFVGSCSSSPFGGKSQDVIERGYSRSILFDLLVQCGLKGVVTQPMHRDVYYVMLLTLQG